MSLTFRKNKKGLYKIKNEISGEYITDEWKTEKEIKKILIEREYQHFIHSAIEIDMEFPAGYYVNNNLCTNDDLHQKGKIFILKNWGKSTIKETFDKICKKLKINLT